MYPERSSLDHRAYADVATAKATFANLPPYLHLRPVTLLARACLEEAIAVTWSPDCGKMRLRCLDKRQGLQMLRINKHLFRSQTSPGNPCLQHVRADGTADGANAGIVDGTIARMIDGNQKPCRHS